MTTDVFAAQTEVEEPDGSKAESSGKNEQTVADSAERSDRGRGGGGGPAWLALLLAVLALAVSGWQWWRSQEIADAWLAPLQALDSRLQADIQELRTSTGQRFESLQALESSARSVGQDASQAGSWQPQQDEWQALQSDIDSLQSLERARQAALQDLQLRLSALDARVSQVSAQSADSGAELDLNEIEYLLQLAEIRLELSGDAATTDRALELADQKLAALDSALYLGVREEIALARASLRLMAPLDQSELSENLDHLQQTLLLARPGSAEGAAEISASPVEAGWWERLKSAISGLVTVRRSDDAAAELPSLADVAWWRQASWLAVEQARWAALRGDQPAYRDSLLRANQLLERRFDSADEASQEARRQIDVLLAVDLKPAVPDISGPMRSLAALRGLDPARPRAEPAVNESVIEPVEDEVTIPDSVEVTAETDGDA